MTTATNAPAPPDAALEAASDASRDRPLDGSRDDTRCDAPCDVRCDVRAQTAAPRKRPFSKTSLLPIPFGAAILWLLASRLSDLDWGAVRTQIAATSPLAWGGALLLTAASFWAVARYDAVAHAMLRSGVGRARALRSGAAATALAQALGLGAVTGSLVRWRLLRPAHVGAGQAVALTALVTGGFFLGWALFTFLITLILPPMAGAAPDWQTPVQLVTIAAIAVILGLTLRGKPIALGTRRFSPPTPSLLLRLTGLAALDTVTAAAVLWVLLPAEMALPFTVLLPAFLIALGCGIFSGTPLGLGAFELTLLALLPQVPEAGLIAGILAFRLVYYVVPALVAAAYVLWPVSAAAATAPRDLPDAGIARDPLSGLIRQGDGAPLVGPGMAWHRHLAGPVGVTLGDPICAGDPLDAACRLSARALRPMAHYKVTADLAHGLAARGWWQMPVASEAVLDPQTFDLNTSRHRQLRRKLRHAAKAGITFSAAPPDRLPLRQMQAVAREWAQAHGGERGFSVGRFTLDLIVHQRVFMAWQGDELLAFVSFHIGRDGWLLDLVRHRTEMPDGTMHALILEALDAAALADADTLSLDCVPFHFNPDTPGLFARHIAPRLFARTPAARGLLQFKSSFDPEWQLRHIAARGPVSLMLGGIGAAFLVNKRVPARPDAMNPPHDLYAQDAFDSWSTPWHPTADTHRIPGEPPMETTP